MKPVFVDTSALIALGNERDTYYSEAQRIRRNLVKSKRKFVTTSLVSVELCNAFSNIKFRQVSIATIESIQKSVMWNYVDIDRMLFDKGFSLYKQMKDKSWGLVDCVSIIVAKQWDCTEIFTSDHHFEQAGFNILLSIEK